MSQKATISMSPLSILGRAAVRSWLPRFPTPMNAARTRPFAPRALFCEAKVARPAAAPAAVNCSLVSLFSFMVLFLPRLDYLRDQSERDGAAFTTYVW